MIVGRIMVAMEAIVSVAAAITMNVSTVVPLKRGCGISHQSAVWLPGAVDTDRRRRHVTAGRSIRPIVQSAPLLYEPVADDSSATSRPLCSTGNVVYVRRTLPRPGFTREVEQRGRKKTNVGSFRPPLLFRMLCMPRNHIVKWMQSSISLVVHAKKAARAIEHRAEDALIARIICRHCTRSDRIDDESVEGGQIERLQHHDAGLDYVRTCRWRGTKLLYTLGDVRHSVTCKIVLVLARAGALSALRPALRWLALCIESCSKLHVLWKIA